MNADNKVQKQLGRGLKPYRQYFSENALWQKLETLGRSIGATVLYPVLLLWHLLKSPTVTLKEKTMIIGALGYFVLPLDLIPDALVGIGYSDDLAALTTAITLLAKSITPEIQTSAREQLHHLLGDFDARALTGIDQIISSAHKILTPKS